MLVAIYDGLHYIDLVTSYRNHAWHGSMFSPTQDDPVFGSISEFRKSLYRSGVRLAHLREWQDLGIMWEDYMPNIFVISGETTALDPEIILEAVSRGSNLIVLYTPTGLYSSYSQSSLNMFRALGLSNEQVETNASKELIISHGSGKIIYLNTDPISDVHFDGGPMSRPTEEDTAQATRRITSIIEKIVTFDVACMDCNVVSLPTSWPVDLELVVELEVVNKSVQALNSVIVDIDVAPQFEPLSNLLFKLTFEPHEAKKIPVRLVPREKGHLISTLTTELTYEGQTRRIYLPESPIVIMENWQSQIRSLGPSSLDFSTVLPRYERYLQPVVDLETILTLLDVDPSSVIQKSRQVGEHTCTLVAEKRLQDYDSSWNFATTIQKLYKHKIISPKAKGYIETVRLLGNLASHPGESFDDADVVVVVHALTLFLDEVHNQRLI